MRRVLYNTQSLDNYLDDVLTHTPDWIQHLGALRQFFECIRKANLTLRPSKCEIGETTVSFLGHTLTKGEMKPTAETIEKIQKVPPPRTLKTAESFPGSGKFLPEVRPELCSDCCTVD